MKLSLDNKNLLITTLLILVAAATRFLPHPQNFSPIYAIALISGAYISDKRLAFAIPVLAMFVSDIFLGFYPSVSFVYFALILTTVLGFILKDIKSLKNVALYSLLSALLFFIITNFGVWFADQWYAKTFNGLIDCYMQGLPFLRWTVGSSLIYAVIMYKLIDIYQSRQNENLQLEREKIK